VAILFLMANGLQRMTRNPKPLSETIDLDFDGFGGIAARVLSIRPSAMLALAGALTLAATLFWAMANRDGTQVIARDPFALFPRKFDAWSGYTTPLDLDVERTLAADDYLNASFSDPAERNAVNLFVAFYDNQTEGNGIHSPEVCLPVGGWEIFSLEPHEVTLANSPYGTFTVNRAVIQKGLSKQLVYYWFEQRGRRMVNDFAAKVSVVYDSLAMGRTDGAMVRFITPITPGETEAEAEARLLRFMDLGLQPLPRFVPL